MRAIAFKLIWIASRLYFRAMDFSNCKYNKHALALERHPNLSVGHERGQLAPQSIENSLRLAII